VRLSRPLGNLNSTEVRGPKGVVRLPGSGELVISPLWRSVSLYCSNTGKQRLPERVSYITSPGNGDGRGWRKRVGLAAGRAISGDYH